jgi:hypothetical protein
MVLPERHRRAYLENFAHLGVTAPDLHARVLIESRDLLPGVANESGAGAPAGGGFALEAAGGGGLTLRKDRVYLESRLEPERNALAMLPEVRGEGTTVLFLGCGLGYHVNALLRREAGGAGEPEEGGSRERGGLRILVERETAVFAAALAVIEPDLFRGLVPLVGLSASEVVGRLRNLGPRRVAVVRHPRCTALHPRYYDEIEDGILKLLRGAVASFATERANARLWAGNILKNVRGLRGRVSATAGWAKRFGGPVVLAASGPRLEDAVRTLRALRGRVPLWALLPSYPFLDAEGVEPDLLVTTDAGFWNRLRLVPGAEVPLLSTWSAEPVLLRNWSGSLALFSHGLPLETAIEGVKASSLFVPMQGTASAVMIRLARAMGFDEIYLAGFDFACRGMRDHHAGAGFDDLLLASSSRLRSWHTLTAGRFRLEPFVEAEGEPGGRVLSSRKLLLYRDWIERELAGGDLARITGGAAMGGVRTITGGTEDGEGGPAEKFRGAEHGASFRAALRRLLEVGKLPPGAFEDDMREARGLLAGRGGTLDVYRFFFGSPREGARESDIAQDAAWAVDALGRRWSGN